MSHDTDKDQLKAVCDRMARKLAAGTSRDLVKMTLHQRLSNPPRVARQPRRRAARPADRPAERAQPISIWSPKMVDGELVFVRPDPNVLGDAFSAKKTLMPRRAALPRRICYLGESVAVGYLYSPHLTPAGLLEEQLRTVAGQGEYEVIDLARAGESLLPLIATAMSALQLDPDIFVIFGGNNWNFLHAEISAYLPQPCLSDSRMRARYAQALREDGFRGPRRLAEQTVRDRVDEALARIAGIARTRSIPVVLIVPEINMADWEWRQPVVWRAGDDTARWYERYERALRLLRDEKWEEAIVEARQMLEIDEGMCPSTHRILARAHVGLGRLVEAREACQAEVDSDVLPTMCYAHCGQATSIVQEGLRRGAREHGFVCIDLPKVYAEHTGSPLPGRRLFFDYCHPTAEGMNVAMAAVTAEILRLAGAADVSWKSLIERLPAPQLAPEVDALAKLGAVSHNSHHMVAVGPKTPILEHWCQEALDASPGVAQAMLDLIEIDCAGACPGPLTAAARRNFASPYRLMNHHGLNWRNLDAEMILAICGTLERNGRPVRDQVIDLLLERFPLDTKGVELAASPLFHWNVNERFFTEVLKLGDEDNRATYRSPWPVSTFSLVCDRTRDVTLDITARLPVLAGWKGGRSGVVVLAVNGHRVGTLDCRETWTRELLAVKRDHLERGINRVTVRWPPPRDGDQALELAIARLQQGLRVDVHPTFGELYSLSARLTETSP